MQYYRSQRPNQKIGSDTSRNPLYPFLDKISYVEKINAIPSGYLRMQVALHIGLLLNQSVLPEIEVVRLMNRLIPGIKCQIDKLPIEYMKMVKMELTTVQRQPLLLKSGMFSFGPVTREVGSLIQNNLHYLHSDREDTTDEFGLFDTGVSSTYPIAYVSFVKLDRKYLAEGLPAGINHENTFVLTRLFSVNSSPSNSISFLISRAVKSIQKKYPKCEAIITTVNPNVFFSGTSFLASGFNQYAEFPFIPCYHHGLYITRRHIQHDLEGIVVEHTELPLQPIKVLILGLKGFVFNIHKIHSISKESYLQK